MSETTFPTWYLTLGVIAAVLIIGGFAVLYWFLSRDKEE